MKMKEISREDIIKVNDTVFPENDKKHFDTILQVIEDRLKQVDNDKNINDIQDIYSLRGICYDYKYDVMKVLAEEMYEALKSASSYISQNNPHWSAPYHNETTREIIETISKWEKYGV
jgi:hypothetical protein